MDFYHFYHDFFLAFSENVNLIRNEGTSNADELIEQKELAKWVESVTSKGTRVEPEQIIVSAVPPPPKPIPTESMFENLNPDEVLIMPAYSLEAFLEEVEQKKNQFPTASPTAAYFSQVVVTEECERHDAAQRLNSFVSSAGYKSIMYVLYYDDEGQSIADSYKKCAEHWIFPMKYRTTVFFESIFYRDILQPQMATWKEKDYLIVGTYKTIDEKKTQTFEDILNLMHVAQKGNWDVIPILRGGTNLMKQGKILIEYSAFYLFI